MSKRYDILLAHPDLRQRNHLEERLIADDFARVIAVTRAREAVAVLCRTPVDALICPIELGDIDIWRLARMIHSGDYGSIGLPILATYEDRPSALIDALIKDHAIHILPTHDEDQGMTDYIAQVIDGRIKHSVLIIEDDESAAHAAAQSLDKAYNVEVCHHGQAGLDAWLARRHDIVLLDVMLPGISGPEILSTIIAEKPDQVVIVLTAYASRERHEDLVFAGAAEFLAKPFDITQLNTLCDRMLQNNRLVKSLHASRHHDAERTRLAFGALVADYKLAQGRTGEASRHLQSALVGIEDVLTDDDWSRILSEYP